MTTSTKPIDGAAVRAMIFDKNIPDSSFLTCEEAAAAFGVSPRTVSEDWARQGFPSPDKFVGKAPVFFVGKIRRYLEEQYRYAVKSSKVS